MTIRISEVIHRWMGWCPAKAGMTFTDRMQGYGMKSDHRPGSADKIIYNRIVDYSSTKTSLSHLLAFGVGITTIVFFIKSISMFYIGADVAVLGCFLLFSAFLLTYNDLKKTTLESRPDTIIIKRPIFKPVVILKNIIKTAEINDNRRPVPQWLMAAVTLIIIPVYSVTGIYHSYYNWMSRGNPASIFIIYMGFLIIINLFFLSIYNYSRIRYKYPKNIVITTTQNKKLVIYGKNSEELAEIQERLV